MSDIQKNKKYFKKEDLMKRLDWLAANAEMHNDLLVQAIALDSIAWMKEQEVISAHWDDDTGHWIEGDRNGIDKHTRTTGETIDTFRCSWCGFYQYWKTPFCPNCGAKMEGW